VELSEAQQVSELLGEGAISFQPSAIRRKSLRDTSLGVFSPNPVVQFVFHKEKRMKNK